MYHFFDQIWNSLSTTSNLQPSPCAGYEDRPMLHAYEEFQHHRGPGNYPDSAKNLRHMRQLIALTPLQDTPLPVINELLQINRLTNFNSTTMEHREQTRWMLKRIAETGLLSGRRTAFEFHLDPMPEAVAKIGLISTSLATLCWVHYALWQMSVVKLGTEKHHRLYEAAGDRLDYVGCCMMTEDGHGSDVAGLELPARYIPSDKGGYFMVNTDVPSARKIWAGGLAQIAQRGVLFARLMLPDRENKGFKDHGGHAFVMELRDDIGRILPGRIIGEMGKWTGVDTHGHKHVLVHVNDPNLYADTDNFERMQIEQRNVANLYDFARSRNALVAQRHQQLLLDICSSGRVQVPLLELPRDLAHILDDTLDGDGCGRKRGLNGVDNGWVVFEQVKIPYDALLDHYCEVTPDGQYVGKNGHNTRHATRLLYQLMENFKRGRQIISIASSAGFRMLAQVFFCQPPSWMTTEEHEQFLLKLVACSYALERAMPMYLSEETVEDHIPASGMKAISSWMMMWAMDDMLNKYGDHPEFPELVHQLRNYSIDHWPTSIYEGPNDVLLQLVARDLAQRFVMNPPEWFVDFDQRGELDAMQEEEWLLSIPNICERAIAALRQRAYRAWSAIKPIMLPYVMDPSKRAQLQDVWMSECSAMGKDMALAFMQADIVAHFWHSALENGDSIEQSLATFYAEMVVGEIIPFENPAVRGPQRHFPPQGGSYWPVPMTAHENALRYQEEQDILQFLPDLIARNGIPMEYLQHMLPRQ